MNAQETIKKIQNKAIRSYAFFTLLLALSIGLAVMSTLFILLERSMHLLMIPTVVFAFVMLAIYFVHSKADYLKPKQITQNLNMTRKEAEYSLELLLLDDDGLNDLQCIQKKIIGRRLFEIENKIPDVFDVKRQLYWFIPLLVVSATIYLAVPDIDPFTVKSHSLVFQDTVILQNEVIVDTTINMFPAFKWIISPPAYMKKPVSVQSAPELNVMEGSSLTLRMAGINNIRQPSLLLNNEKVILMSHADGQWEARVKAGQQSGFYQVAVRFADSTVSRSVYYPITVHRDEAPQIVVEGLADYQESSLSAGSIQFNVILADDHGVNEGHLLATVSKGEGENVKFRESIIPLDITRGSKRQLKKIELRFSDLSMENGDELYFFISARDNKSKGAQETRTSTYFIIIPDSTKESITLSSGLGVDRMPAYFRSQRQIIIDTEKLLEEKGKINTKEFNERSNNLAHDQKVLRLRYGRFLGEEFEIELGPDELHEEGEGHDVLQEFGHDHDTQEAHEVSVLDNTEKEDPLAEFTHEHDTEEEATFHFSATQVKLRSALSLMWDSELHLRMNIPAMALPVEYKILKLLKEVQQHARIYVERIGFEPPPIKEGEKRLTGDLEAIHPARYTTQVKAQEMALHALISFLEECINGVSKVKLQAVHDEMETIPLDLSPQNLDMSGKRLTEAAVENPAYYLAALDIFDRLKSGRKVHDREVRYLQWVAYNLIGEWPPRVASAGSQTFLTDSYLRNLQRQRKGGAVE